MLLNHLLTTRLLGLLLVLAPALALPGPSAAQPVLSPGIGSGQNWSRSWADVSGDGRADYCVLHGTDNDTISCWYATTEGKFNSTASFTTVMTRNHFAHMWWVDVDGDGRSDLCRGYNYGHSMGITCRYAKDQFTTGQSRAVAFAAFDEYGVQTAAGATGPEDFFLVDVNSDRLADLCYVNQQLVIESRVFDLRCHLSDRTGFADVTAAWTSQVLEPGGAVYPREFVDVNGDSFPDYCRAGSVNGDVAGYGQFRCLLGGDTGFSTTEWVSPTLDRGYAEGAQWVDANGDGKTDYCRITGSSGSYRLRCTLATGLGWDTANERISPVIGDVGHGRARWWIDINADGLPDFCRAVGANPDVTYASQDVEDVNGQMSCRLNKGDGSATDANGMFYYSDITLDVNWGRGDGGRTWCDPAGTGIPTLCRNTLKFTYGERVCEWTGNAEGGTGYEYCYNPVVGEVRGLLTGLGTDQTPQAYHPLLLSYSDGLGAETRITYQPLTDPDVYASSGPGEHPRRVIGPPPTSPVVYETRAWTTEADAAGQGLTLTGNARYFYRDLTQDVWAGTSLGFRERWMFSEGTNTLDRTVFFQGRGDTAEGGDYGSIENNPLEIGLVKLQERYAANVANPTPTGQALSRFLVVKGLLGRVLNATVGKSASVDGYLLLQRTTNRLADTSPANPRYRYIGQSTVQSWDLDGTTRIALPDATTLTTQDEYGNVLTLEQRREQTTVAGNKPTLTWTTTTTNAYDTDPRWRRLGRLKKSTVTSTAPSLAEQLNALPRSPGPPGADAVSSALAAVPQEPPKPLPLPPQLLMTILQLLLDD